MGKILFVCDKIKKLFHSVHIESDTNEKRELSVREHAYEPNMCKMSGMVNRNTFTDALIFIGTAGAMLQYVAWVMTTNGN